MIDEIIAHAARRGAYNEARQTFGIPTEGGLWVAGTHAEYLSNGRVTNGVSLRTFLSENEMSEDKRRYRNLVLAEGVVAAEKRWPELFNGRS